MKRWRQALWIGWSATPGTKGLGRLYDDLLIPTTTQELIDTDHLSPFKVFAPSHPDLSGVKTVAGDYHEGQLSERMQRAHIVSDVVETWCRLGRGRPTLVFAVDRAHGKVLHEKFCSRGVFAEYVDAFTPREDRDGIRSQMERGEIEVVVNIGCLTTGCDWPFVSCVVLARPTKSRMLYQQIIGRGLRTHPDKDFCLVLDHSDTTLRLGFVTDIEWDALDDGMPNVSGRRRREPLEPRECVECHALMPRASRQCPECGREIRVVSRVKVGKGELTEVTRRQNWYSQLLGIANECGYSSGWAARAYRKRFGLWPRGLAKIARDAAPEVRGFVRLLLTTAYRQNWYSQLLGIANERGYSSGWVARVGEAA